MFKIVGGRHSHGKGSSSSRDQDHRTGKQGSLARTPRASHNVDQDMSGIEVGIVMSNAS
jgi:hypothetical protein